MIRVVIGVAALWIYGWGIRRFGFRSATRWACLLVMSAWPFSFTAAALSDFIPATTMAARIGIGVTAFVIASVMASCIGWGRVLTGIFAGALIVVMIFSLGIVFVGGMSLVVHGA